MRVLHICESYGGGVKKHLDLISKVMDDTVLNYFYISPYPNEEITINSDNIKVDKEFSNRKNPFNLLFTAKRILTYIEKINPSVIHFHSTFAGMEAILLHPLLKRKNIKFVYTPHAYFSQKELSALKKKIVCRLEKSILKKMDKVIHVSQQEEQHCFEQNLLPKAARSKSVVTYNGVEQPSYRKTEKNKEKTVFVNVARCVEQKNPELFLQIAKEYLKLDNNAEFIFVGDGVKLEAIRKEIDFHGLADKIKFIGYSNNVQQYLEQADFYLSTSRYEGMPYSVIEAMAVGLPLILSDVVGHKELIGENGFLYNDKDLNNMAELLLNIRSLNNSDYIKMVKYSINKYQSDFSAKENIVKIQSLYLKENR